MGQGISGHHTSHVQVLNGIVQVTCALPRVCHLGSQQSLGSDCVHLSQLPCPQEFPLLAAVGREGSVPTSQGLQG